MFGRFASGSACSDGSRLALVGRDAIGAHRHLDAADLVAVLAGGLLARRRRDVARNCDDVLYGEPDPPTTILSFSF